MAVVTIAEVKSHLRVDYAEEDRLIQMLVDGAQNHIERLLGYRLLVRYGDTDQDPVPPALEEAVLQLTAWWYNNREAASEEAREIPFGVREIVAEYREFTF